MYITPWGVEEDRKLRLLDILMSAGGHFASELVLYGEGIDPEAAQAVIAASPACVLRA